MAKKKSPFITFLIFITIAGNILFMLWITYNGMKEHFRGTVYEKISYVVLMGLLLVNTYLVIRHRK